MNVLLVKLPEPVKSTQKICFMPPVGLWSIAHHLRRFRKDHVVVIDCHLSGSLELLKDTLTSPLWDLVGLSVQFSIQDAVYREAALMCAKTNVHVVAGGFHASATPAPPGVHEVLKGAGETGFVPETNFNDIEYPPITADMMEPYWKKALPHDLQSKTSRWMPIEFSRGCRRACEYCGVPRFWGPTTYYSKDNIVRHLDRLVEIGVKELFIEDDNCLAEPTQFRWIMNEMKKRKLWWSTPNGVFIWDLLPMVSELRASGCWRVSLPFETGTLTTATLMQLGRKWMPMTAAKRLVAKLKTEGIKTCGFFIIGYPGESLEDIQKTIDFANALPLGQRIISIATPYPGTALFERCKENGYLLVAPPKLYEQLLFTHGMIKTPEFTPGEVEQIKFDDRMAALIRKVCVGDV